MTASLVLISGFDVTRLAAAAHVSPTTVRRCYAGRPCEVSTRVRLERAARELGLPLPPQPVSSHGARPELDLVPLHLAAGKS